MIRPIVSLLLGITTFLTLVLVDVRAEAAFDAPKRLAASLGIAVACAIALVRGELPLGPGQRPRADRIALACAGAALLGAFVSAVLSPRAGIALDTLRTILVFAAAAWLCAVTAVWSRMKAGFIAGALVNAALSIAQWSGIAQPFRYATQGGRADVSALVGNTGVLALVLAFALLLVLPRVLERRPAWIAAAALLVAALIANRSATVVLALAAACGVFAARHLRRGRVVIAAICVAAAALVVALVVARGTDGVQSANRLLTFRLGPWAAAGEMALARPLTGFGPGTFAAEYAPHFLAGERRWGASLAHPLLRGSYAQAHNDYLQAFAELGIPATLLALAALAIVVARARRGAETVDDTAVLALLVAGAVAALAWFPLQRPETALVLLAAIGRAWRISR